jgi:hypothetical protein
MVYDELPDLFVDEDGTPAIPATLYAFACTIVSYYYYPEFALTLSF